MIGDWRSVYVRVTMYVNEKGIMGVYVTVQEVLHADQKMD
jgi:hypothetical protein